MLLIAIENQPYQQAAKCVNLYISSKFSKSTRKCWYSIVIYKVVHTSGDYPVVLTPCLAFLADSAAPAAPCHASISLIESTSAHNAWLASHDPSQMPRGKGGKLGGKKGWGGRGGRGGGWDGEEKGRRRGGGEEEEGRRRGGGEEEGRMRERCEGGLEGRRGEGGEG